MSLLENAYENAHQAFDESASYTHEFDALTNTLYNNINDISSPMTLDDDPFQPLPVPQYVEEETDEEVSAQIYDPMDSSSTLSTLDQPVKHVHDCQRNQSIPQYNASAQYESLIEQFKEKERYWRERCQYVENQLDVMNNEMRKIQRDQQTSPNGSDSDKDEKIRRLHAKIASRDSVIESLEEKVAQTERFSPSTSRAGSRRTSGLPRYTGNHDMSRMEEMATNMHHIENAKKALSDFIKLKESNHNKDMAFAA